MQHNEKDTRRDYDQDGLNRSDLNINPFKQMEDWLEQAKKISSLDATAMTLATVDENSRPSTRIVLLKYFNEQGFCWYTNYSSRKGQQLEKNPQAALSFFWRESSRQVQIEGKVIKLSAQDADEYFHSRPLASQISAAISQQSRVIESREILEQKAATLSQQSNEPIVRPDSWGGYLLIPEYFEFWQGRPSRLHDRFVYRLKNNEWLIERLQP